MIIHTESVTPLEKAMVEASHAGGCHVWLRNSITQTTDPDSRQDVYEADEVYFFSPESVTVAAVEADFTSLWDAHEQDGLPDVERQASRISDVEDALIELAGLIGGE